MRCAAVVSTPLVLCLRCFNYITENDNEYSVKLRKLTVFSSPLMAGLHWLTRTKNWVSIWARNFRCLLIDGRVGQSLVFNIFSHACEWIIHCHSIYDFSILRAFVMNVLWLTCSAFAGEKYDWKVLPRLKMAPSIVNPTERRYFGKSM